jgi:hypothetical protein
LITKRFRNNEIKITKTEFQKGLYTILGIKILIPYIFKKYKNLDFIKLKIFDKTTVLEAKAKVKKTTIEGFFGKSEAMSLFLENDKNEKTTFWFAKKFNFISIKSEVKAESADVFLNAKSITIDK